MKISDRFRFVRPALIGAALFLFVSNTLGQTTAFTYQGKLTDNMSAASGTVDLQFALYDAAATGTQVGTTVDKPAVPVTNGAFTTELDFGINAFSGAERYLEIRLRRNSTESYVVLSPRQRITSVPYAMRSATSDVDQRLKLVGAQRWDLLGTKNYQVYAFPVQIKGLAFDGTNIWISMVNNTVAKVRPSDGATLGTFPVGTDPRGMATDGTHMWVANAGSNNVTKLRISDGANQGTFPVGTTPTAVAFDGTHMWVINSGSSNVTLLRASDGLVQATWLVAADPRGIVFDGRSVWVASFNGQLTNFNGSGGARNHFYFLSGITFDGTHIWVSYYNNAQVAKIRVSDGVTLETVNVGSQPSAMAFDGKSVWAITASRFLTKFGIGGLSGTTVPFDVGSDTNAIAFDGTHVWVSSWRWLVKVAATP